MGKAGAVALGALALGALLAFALCYAEAVYAYGGGYFGLLAFVALTGAALEVRTARAMPRKVVGGASLVATLLAVCAFVAGAVLAAQPFASGLGWEARPVMALLVVVGCGVMARKNLRVETTGVDLEIATIEKNYDGEDSSSGAGKVAECCKSTLWVLFMLAVALASVNVVMLANENIKYAPETSAMLEVDGHFIHTRCIGAGSPTVFFEHGLGGNSLDWTWVQNGVAKSGVRTCSYDRAGYGRSLERGAQNRTSDRLAKETKLVLDGLGISEAIFVGHSFAGYNLRVLEANHPDLFQGLVLVDPVNPLSRTCDPDAVTGSGIYGLGLYIAETGVLRILNMVGFLNSFVPVAFLPSEPYDYISEYKHFLYRVGYFRTRVDEYLYWGKNCDMVKRLEGEAKAINVPVTLVAPGASYYGVNATYAAAITDLSPQGKLVLINDTRADHTSILFMEDLAQVTIDEVNLLIDQVRAA